MKMQKQRGHFDLSFLGWIVGVVGLALTGGGIWLLVVAARMLI